MQVFDQHLALIASPTLRQRSSLRERPAGFAGTRVPELRRDRRRPGRRGTPSGYNCTFPTSVRHAAAPHPARAQCAVAVPRRQARGRAGQIAARPRDRRRRGHVVALRRGRPAAGGGRRGRPRAHPDLRPAGRRGRSGGRPAARRPAPGHDLAVVDQGDRHRAPLRPRGRAPDRARDRVPRGPARRGPADRRRARRAAAAHPRPDDAGRVRRSRPWRAAVLARPATAADDGSARRRRRRRARGGERRARSRAGEGRDRLPRRRVPRDGPRPDRRRAHDVRAGQLRALPAQDLQRRLDRRRQAAAEAACSR